MRHPATLTDSPAGLSRSASGRCRKTPAARGARAMIGARFRARGIGGTAARFLPAFCAERAGRRGASSSRVSSPEIFTAHTPVKRSTGASGSGSRISHPAAFGSFPALRATGAASDAKAPTFSLTRALPCSRATSPAYGPGLLSTRSLAGASGRCDCPNRCGGTGCASPSAAAWKIADTRGLEVRAALSGSSTAHSRISDRPALTSSAITADPRRADPGNLLAGAVSVLRRLSIMCNWPVALRGGGHIAGVV